MNKRKVKDGDCSFRILFVCTGNTCRSPMAVGILMRLMPAALRRKVGIESAGVSAREGEPPSAGALDITRRNGVDISQHRTRPLTRELIETSDLILVMQRTHLERVRELCPSRSEHALLITELGEHSEQGGTEIPDPHVGGDEAYARCFPQIEESLKRGMGFLLELINSKCLAE